MNKYRINIVIVEPSLIIYEGLSNIFLQEVKHQCVLTHFDSYDELESELSAASVDVVIINPTLISHHTDDFVQLKMAHSEVVWMAMVYSFVDKHVLSLFDDLIQICDDPTVISQTVSKLVSTEPRNSKFSAKEQLSQREIDVLKLLVQGMLNKEIADELNISTHTVISHRKNIVQKTGIKSQAGLTIYAISNKLINIEDY